MSTVSAYAATSATAPLTKTTITRRDVGPHDVTIEIKFAGICHSDIHTVRAEWGEPNYPVVPGHEIAGVVTEIGPEVTKFKVGDRVGVGCFVDSCRECASCRAGLEQYCERGMIGTYNAVGRDGEPTQGGYSGAIVVDENYALRIPDSIPLDAAAPLLCAGITLYSPLRHWNAGPGKRIAIIGLGGLGHMGVKLAAAMGAEVTVLSPVAEEDGGRAAPRRRPLLRDQRPRRPSVTLQGSFDLILNTVSANLDLSQYLSLLRVDGTLVELGAPEHPMEVPAMPLLGMRRRSVRLDDRWHRRDPGDAGLLR